MEGKTDKVGPREAVELAAEMVGGEAVHEIKHGFPVHKLRYGGSDYGFHIVRNMGKNLIVYKDAEPGTFYEFHSYLPREEFVEQLKGFAEKLRKTTDGGEDKGGVAILHESFHDMFLQTVGKVNEDAQTYPTYTDQQTTNALARTLFAEGRGEGEAGMKRVLDTILARSGNDKTNIVGIISEPSQFSCWNGMKPHEWAPDQFKVRAPSAAAKDAASWETAQKLAKAVMDGTYVPVHTEPFYHTTSVSPQWSKGKNGTVDGTHKFYTAKEIDGTDAYVPKSRYTVAQVNDDKLMSPKEKIAAAAAAAASKTAASAASPKIVQKSTQPAPKTTPKITPKAAPKTAPTNTTYSVKRGDTVSAIAKRNGISVADIQKANAGLNPDVIKPGQSLTIPTKQ